MHCYCYDEFVNKQNTDFLNINFKDIDPADEKLWCTEWFTAFA